MKKYFKKFIPLGINDNKLSLGDGGLLCVQKCINCQEKLIRNILSNELLQQFQQPFKIYIIYINVIN